MKAVELQQYGKFIIQNQNHLFSVTNVIGNEFAIQKVNIMKLRWLEKEDGTKVLQQLIERKYNDGCGHIDIIEHWEDVPIEPFVSEGGD